MKVRIRRQRKPLAFNTTLRNPVRMAQFVSIIDNFDGQKLTTSVIYQIEAQFISQGIYYATRATLGNYRNDNKHTASDTSAGAAAKVTKIYNNYNHWYKQRDKNKAFPAKQILYLLKNTYTSHKEAGYNPGWESRFGTQVSFLNELGFIYAQKGDQLKVSPNGKLLISNYINGHFKKHVSNRNRYPEYSAYLTAFSKYQTNNPWRRNTIKLNFMVLYLKTSLYLKHRRLSPYIHKDELAFFAVWPNNDYKTLAEFLNKFRKKYKHKDLPEIIYKYAMNIMDPDTDTLFQPASEKFIKSNEKRIKRDKILSETPDDIFRKLRLTHVISLCGNGYYLGLNTFERKKIKYIVNNFHDITNSPIEVNKDIYFKYMGKIEDNLSFDNPYSKRDISAMNNAKLRFLNEKAQEYDWSFIKKEMLIACKHHSKSSSELLSHIEKPAVMEFLSAVAIQKAIGDKAKVQPNYKADDHGTPYATASGQNSKNSGADINVYQGDLELLLEPTTANSRSFQCEHEVPSINAHLINAIQDNKYRTSSNTFSILLAGRIVKPFTMITIGSTCELDNKYYKGHAQFYAWNSNGYISLSKHANSLKDYMKNDPKLLPNSSN